VRIAFQNRAIHIRTRVPFIGVADNQFGIPGHVSRQFPLVSCRKTGTAAAPQAGILDLLNDFTPRSVMLKPPTVLSKLNALRLRVIVCRD